VTAIPPSPYVWIIAFAGLALVGSAVSYVRHATALARCINERCPALWDKLYGPARSYPSNADRLEWLVLLNAASAEHPDDPEFKWHLEQARWSIAICFLAFVAFILALGNAYPS
jgi:hypothetical protein